jgi:cytoskeleton-associated protein 5
VVPALIAKGFTSRPKARKKAFELILMYIEVEKHKKVQEGLIKGMENKMPTVVQSCLEIYRIALNLYGNETITLEPVIKQLNKLLEAPDQTVRDECKLLCVEMYRWGGKEIGRAILKELDELPRTPTINVICADLEKEFKNCSGKPIQQRFLRSQQDLKAKLEMQQQNAAENEASGNGGGSAGGVSVAEVEVEQVDPYSLMDPVDIMPRLPKDFFVKCEEKKWQDRKDAVDALLAVLQKAPRLDKAVDYFEMVNTLKKLVAKDANVNVMMIAAKCIAGLASGLRKDFNKYALNALEPCMERFKEKKQNIVDAMREACDAIYPATNLEQIQECCCTFLAHKTPCVRQHVALYLARCFAMAEVATFPKRILKLYLPPLLKNLSDADVTVRDASAEAMGAIYRVLGEKIFTEITGVQDKLDKIKEFADKCVLLNSRGEPRDPTQVPPATETRIE